MDEFDLAAASRQGRGLSWAQYRSLLLEPAAWSATTLYFSWQCYPLMQPRTAGVSWWSAAGLFALAVLSYFCTLNSYAVALAPRLVDEDAPPTPVPPAVTNAAGWQMIILGGLLITGGLISTFTARGKFGAWLGAGGVWLVIEGWDRIWN